MDFQKKEILTKGIKVFLNDGEREVGRAHLYLIYNDLHPGVPYGLLEDVFVDESQRGQGVGTKLVQTIIDEAKAQGCYKLVATSRHERGQVHELYEKLGFKDHGIEFRIDF